MIDLYGAVMLWLHGGETTDNDVIYLLHFDSHGHFLHSPIGTYCILCS